MKPSPNTVPPSISPPPSESQRRPLTLQQALESARETRSLVVGEGALYETPSVLRTFFDDKPVIIVADSASFKAAGRQLEAILESEGIDRPSKYIFKEAPLPAEFAMVERLEIILQQTDATPVAVGSGTINDLVKLVAHRVRRPYLCVATAASMDGYTAFGASITYRGAKQTFDCPAPRAVVADTSIIANAPLDMTASGYADLLAKVTAGADWLIADALGIEPIDTRSWQIVQNGLEDALADPAKARSGDIDAIDRLTKGLMLGGFAMQWSKSSRPASGAEHQFSHLWDMEHHVHKGQAPSHGFKVGIATLAISALYAWLIDQPLDEIDIAACCDTWPSLDEIRSRTQEEFFSTDFLDTSLAEVSAKYIPPSDLALQLRTLKSRWPELRTRLSAQILPPSEVRRRLELVGAPTHPEQIGISTDRLRNAFVRAQRIRRRFTVLDLLERAGLYESALEALFNPQSPHCFLPQT